MRKIYLDTNVILEHAMQRSNYRQVVELFHLAESGAIECYTSAATFFTLAFFLRKDKNSKQIFKIYLSFIKTLTTRDEDLHAAVNSSFTDIEDGFQYYSALGKCDAFITFNKKDFIRHQNKRLPCLTPSEFLNDLI
ncbi:PIN domain-containing protein [Pedobacter sp. BS3]|uniref:type II toxin-antitoxin system VapC family toxin n=1 Tax=Pedobacter sp. BS3 TaxID=2567937 RepID=UPI0011EF919F|nr:PIN domain-containing protein [Pedobacter sp. BS3]TZF82770.1 PIN domain-containing protein [Pedobacter sp. BS3]